ncbi:MAG: HipA domain-containing protein [Pseudomonadota bacterium]
MTTCKISLRTVGKRSKYPDYVDSEFTELFGSLRVNPTLALTRAAFQQESVRYTTGLSISGVQQKLSVAIDEQHRLQPVTIGGSYILKPSPEEFPYAAENEHTAMQSSELLGIRTAQCGLVGFSDDELVYITQRFDRLADGNKLHQEDLVQGFNLPSDNKYSRSYEEAGMLILDMTNGRKAAVLDYLRRVMHAYLIGNDDMHLKNTSLQRAAGNTSRFYDYLTPHYDCLFAGTFESRNAIGFLALDLFADGFLSNAYEEYGFYTGHDFLELAQRLSIPERPVRSFVASIESKRNELSAMIQRSYMPENMKQTAATTIEERLRALKIGL